MTIMEDLHEATEEAQRLRARVAELETERREEYDGYQRQLRLCVDRIAELGLNLGMAESAHQDDLRQIEALKDALQEIYRLRGEDPEIKRICSRALGA